MLLLIPNSRRMTAPYTPNRPAPLQHNTLSRVKKKTSSYSVACTCMCTIHHYMYMYNCTSWRQFYLNQYRANAQTRGDLTDGVHHGCKRAVNRSNHSKRNALKREESWCDVMNEVVTSDVVTYMYLQEKPWTQPSVDREWCERRSSLSILRWRRSSGARTFIEKQLLSLTEVKHRKYTEFTFVILGHFCANFSWHRKHFWHELIIQNVILSPGS